MAFSCFLDKYHPLQHVIANPAFLPGEAISQPTRSLPRRHTVLVVGARENRRLAVTIPFLSTSYKTSLLRIDKHFL